MRVSRTEHNAEKMMRGGDILPRFLVYYIEWSVYRVAAVASGGDANHAVQEIWLKERRKNPPPACSDAKGEQPLFCQAARLSAFSALLLTMKPLRRSGISTPPAELPAVMISSLPNDAGDHIFAAVK